MKILVLSDSHNDIASIEQAIAAEGGIDHILHAGDYAKDMRFAKRGKIPFDTVKGNCDGALSLDKEEQILEYEGIRILFTHGHKYGVKSGTEALVKAAKDKKCAAAVFGHTHRALCINEEGVLLFNPGSISRTKSNTQTYGILQTDGNGDIIKAEIKYLN